LWKRKWKKNKNKTFYHGGHGENLFGFSPLSLWERVRVLRRDALISREDRTSEAMRAGLELKLIILFSLTPSSQPSPRGRRSIKQKNFPPCPQW
jgi:hypothetical protein